MSPNCLVKSVMEHDTITRHNCNLIKFKVGAEEENHP